jgi:hypothetical protein
MMTPHLQQAQNAWQLPLLTERIGFRTPLDLGRLQGSIVNGRIIEPGEVNKALRTPSQINLQRRDQAINPFISKNISSYGGVGMQRVGPGWGTDSDAQRFDRGEIEVIIDGERWIEEEGVWRRDRSFCSNTFRSTD